MGVYDENIDDNSKWFTATPTPTARLLPFSATEAGHFIAQREYAVKRDMHNSYLLIYTIGGSGSVITDNTKIDIAAGNAIIIDCHKPHSYYSASEKWEFLWIHFNGISMKEIFDVLYPSNVHAIKIDDVRTFKSRIVSLIERIEINTMENCFEISSQLHTVFNIILKSTLENEKCSRKKDFMNDIDTAIEFIKNNYSKSISIDDIISDIHISKYHFIRMFRRVMGITPYSYLMNYRINVSKTMLRSTDKTIVEISELCGFMDASNFITQFKKHTGQKPLQYRRDFS